MKQSRRNLQREAAAKEKRPPVMSKYARKRRGIYGEEEFLAPDYKAKLAEHFKGDA